MKRRARTKAKPEAERVDVDALPVIPKHNQRAQALAMPAHVQDIISKTGEQAAHQLHRLLHDPQFQSYRVSDQLAAMTLAFNRAYGLPENNSVSKSISLNLNSDNSDAVASALRTMALKDVPKPPANGTKQ